VRTLVKESTGTSIIMEAIRSVYFKPNVVAYRGKLQQYVTESKYIDQCTDCLSLTWYAFHHSAGKIHYK
jgi:hypothetical protein